MNKLARKRFILPKIFIKQSFKEIGNEDIEMRRIGKGEMISRLCFRNIAIWCAVLILAISSVQMANAATFTVSNLDDSGAGSLRDAITQANGSAGADTINFTTGAGTINLLSPLPAITDTVAINGGTTPTIELNGAGTNSAGSSSIGFYIRAGGCQIQGFIINRFSGDAGIRMDTDGIGTDNSNIIVGNYIGTNVAGNAALPNINRGILIVGTIGHTIGGNTASARNVISGNSGRGIEITGGGNATINGNYIGTNAAGTGDLGNTSHGVQIVNSSNTIIGGGTADTRNVISGNNGSGISVIGDIGTPASSNIIRGNYIGVNSGGNTALPNSGSGILIQGSGNSIGGLLNGQENVISGNLSNGVSISSSLATGNTIFGNLIGVGANGTTALGNAANGIQISNNSNGNTIGGTDVPIGTCDASCNVIANNGDVGTVTAHAGVYVDSTGGTGNQIRRNSIHSNLGIGIDLGTVGANTNDANDSDTGPNNLQNKPVLTAANDSGFIEGNLSSTPQATFVIDFFSNTVADGSANSEGRTYIGSTQVTTNSSGNANFTFTTSAILTAGQFITAMATEDFLSFAPQSTGDSSELSDSQIVVATPANVSISGTITKNGSPLSNVTVNLGGSSTATVQTDPNGDYSFTGLMVGGNYTVTPTLAANTFDPINRSYSNVVNDVNDADFEAFDDGTNPRILRVVNSTTTPGQSVIVPIQIDSQGDEVSFTFSLSYDSAILSNPQLACGADAGNCTLTFNTTVSGQIGVSIDPEVPFTPGTRELLTVMFDTAVTTAPNTPVNFTDTPAVREVSDDQANPLPAAYVNGFVVFTQGLESDVAPRPDGNGAVSATDVSQVRRFAVGLDSYSTTANEFQRADAAPISSLGNGIVASTDVVQARRYQVGLDPAQGAGGPTAPSGSLAEIITSKLKNNFDRSFLGGRVVRVIDKDTSAGQQVTVSIEVDAMGDEQNYGFSINYDNGILSNPVVTIGSGATGGNVLENTNIAGKIGFSVDFGGGTIPAGNNRQLVTVRFDVAANAPAGTMTPLTFGDSPAFRETSSPAAQPLPTTYQDGNVNILAPTAASVSIGGRVLTENGRGLSRTVVRLTQQSGETKSVRTNQFGYYNFSGIEVGQTVTITALSKGYNFTPQVVELNDNVRGLNLIGEPRR